MTRSPDTTAPSDIRLRPDGSIDTAFYMARGRRERTKQAHRMAKSDLPDPRAHHFLRSLFF